MVDTMDVYIVGALLLIGMILFAIKMVGDEKKQK
jgi:hypothetical protein